MTRTPDGEFTWGPGVKPDDGLVNHVEEVGRELLRQAVGGPVSSSLACPAGDPCPATGCPACCPSYDPCGQFSCTFRCNNERLIVGKKKPIAEGEYPDVLPPEDCEYSCVLDQVNYPECQVHGRVKATKSCRCGKPTTPNVIHRENGPCYMEGVGLERILSVDRTVQVDRDEPDGGYEEYVASMEAEGATYPCVKGGKTWLAPNLYIGADPAVIHWEGVRYYREEEPEPEAKSEPMELTSEMVEARELEDALRRVPNESRRREITDKDRELIAKNAKATIERRDKERAERLLREMAMHHREMAMHHAVEIQKDSTANSSAKASAVVQTAEAIYNWLTEGKQPES